MVVENVITPISFYCYLGDDMAVVHVAYYYFFSNGLTVLYFEESGGGRRKVLAITVKMP